MTSIPHSQKPDRRPTDRKIVAIQRALDEAGVEFTNGERPGCQAAGTKKPWTLEDEAAAINRCFGQISKSEPTTDQRRLRAGFVLIDARKMVPEDAWEAWCNKNINRRMDVIRKVMWLAGDPDQRRPTKPESE
jgi:hypothetical protein